MHAQGFLPFVDQRTPVLDLGSGGGVPGLVLAVAAPQTEFTLVDVSERRTDWLRRAVRRLGVEDRVRVVTAAAEALGHDPDFRERFGAVVARSFAPALVTAECASGFLRIGGVAVISEPPVVPVDRWPTGSLTELGLTWRSQPDERYAVLDKEVATPAGVPRAKRVSGRTS